MALDDLFHDGEAEPGPGLGACGSRPEESLEDQRPVLGRDPRPAVMHFESSTAGDDPDRCAIGAELDGIAHQVVDGAFERSSLSGDEAARGGFGRDVAARSAARSCGGVGRQVGQVDRRRRLVCGSGLAREFHQLAYQLAQFAEFRVDVGEDAALLGPLQ